MNDDKNKIEELSALWFDAEFLKQPETVYRADGRQRWYFTETPRSVKLYESTTTWIKRVLPMSYGLLQWFKKNDENTIDEVLNDTSEYGTFFHIEASRLIIDKEYDLGAIPIVVGNYPTTADKSWWTEKLTNDLLSLAQFLKDKDVQPLACELTLTSEIGGFRRAGTLDLPCFLTFNKKKVLAIVDFKTGGIWDEYKFQLEDYKRLFNENFPGLEAVMCFNWSPTDWRDKPTYKFVNQTMNKSEMKDFDLLYRRAKLNKVKPPKVKTGKGLLTVDNINKCFKVQTLEKFHFEKLKAFRELQ